MIYIWIYRTAIAVHRSFLAVTLSACQYPCHARSTQSRRILDVTMVTSLSLDRETLRHRFTTVTVVWRPVISFRLVLYYGQPRSLIWPLSRIMSYRNELYTDIHYIHYSPSWAQSRSYNISSRNTGRLPPSCPDAADAVVVVECCC